MPVCIQYAKPSSGQFEGEIYGLDVAVNNFLSAWFRHGREQQFLCLPVDLPSFDHFRTLARGAGIDDRRCIGLDPRTPKSNLETMGLVFRPDPLIGDALWRRRQLKGNGYAACGLVHTMSGERIARAVGDLCIAPAQPGDALICPSPAIRDAVQNLWNIYSDYLNHHFGLGVTSSGVSGKHSSPISSNEVTPGHKCPVETPVIPLGIDTEKFARITSPEKRTAQRQLLNIAPDEIVILFVGRLSFATKAHPLALWQAAERAAQQSKKKLRVVMHGYFKPKVMEAHFRELAAATFKNARIDFIMNDNPRFAEGFWAGADIFVSLSDNIQESFGLTPVEAMASGLPAIVSDWDGYRGGVRDGVDGFLIPTLTPPPEAGLEIADYYYNEQNYGVALTGTVQSTAIDGARCAEALLTLINDDNKRKSMGASGSSRARENYDWRHIIKLYENLWDELARKRASAALKPVVPVNWQAAHPHFPNPWAMFASFPSSHLKPENRLRVMMDRAAIEALLKHEMNYFVPELLMPKDVLLNFIEVIRNAGSLSITDMLAGFPPHEHARLYRCCGWMLKLGICVIEK